ncbi:MAG: hypothetical protein ACK5V3_03015 [Bdellovibrionales bacterium]
MKKKRNKLNYCNNHNLRLFCHQIRRIQVHDYSEFTDLTFFLISNLEQQMLKLPYTDIQKIAANMLEYIQSNQNWEIDSIINRIEGDVTHIHELLSAHKQDWESPYK